LKKPFVYINAAMSLDGKISTIERRQVRISSDRDMSRVDALRASSDAVLVGKNTLITDDPKLTVKSSALREERIKKGLPANPLKVALGCINELNIDSDFLNHGQAGKILFTTSKSDNLKIDELKTKATVYVSSEDEINLDYVLETLYKLGVRRLMVEGGGRTIYRFLAAGVVDEVYVCVAPIIYGGEDAPTLVDGAGFTSDNAIKLELFSMEKEGSELVLKYRVLDA